MRAACVHRCVHGILPPQTTPCYASRWAWSVPTKASVIGGSTSDCCSDGDRREVFILGMLAVVVLVFVGPLEVAEWQVSEGPVRMG